MKATKLCGIVSLMLLAVMAFAVGASALPTIDKVEVDGTTVFENQVNRLSIESGSEFDVDVWLTSAEADRNVRVEAEISGYEHDNDNNIDDKTELFDTESNTTYKKTLTLSIPADVDQDSYKLRITVTDRNSGAVIQTYNLVLEMPRHDLAIEDIVTYPEGTATAGQALLATVRLENYGQKDEKDVRVHVSIPELGIGATDYVDKVESDDKEETEELYMRLPSDAKAGDYTLKVDVDYNDGHDHVSATKLISIEAAPQPKATVTQTPVVQPVVQQPEKSLIRSVLEGILLVLVGLLVIVAIILGISKLSRKDE
ncbi:MAG TPA: hypothetical protein VLJ21_05565 [Candidatus Binatia bacterium]|nr:hypothetical protein [Candidatus Binatia bacterium]